MGSDDVGIILVVDDELDVLDTVRRGLEKWGYQVDTFSNPHIALRAFTGSPSRYSLILTDFRMPGLTGVELAKQAKRIRNDVKVLIMTAFEMDQEMLQEVPTIDKSEVLKKPFRLDQLCKAVRKQLTFNKRATTE
ncbi:MAG: response regulator [Nitrososphaera sp.]